MERISRNHEKIKNIKKLIKSSDEEYTISDDLQILKIVLDYNITIDTLLYNYECEYKEETRNLLNNLIQKAINTYEISSKTYEELALKENHAGIIALIKFPKYQIKDFINKEFLVVLDHLEIPGNIGTIYRTLDSVKCDGIIMLDSVSKVTNQKITSSSRGCNLIIPTLDLNYDDALEFLQNNNYDIYLGEPNLGLNYQQYNYKGKIALVVGNERFGINKDWYNHPHKNVFIPMDGNQNSLNVSVAASIIAYEAYMKRRN
ncbi:MAG: TrmH family RNA methyltransferase [Anaeroplasma sp.]